MSPKRRCLSHSVGGGGLGGTLGYGWYGGQNGLERGLLLMKWSISA